MLTEKKYFSKIEVWHFTTLRDPPSPRFGKRPHFFRFFFVHPSLIDIIIIIMVIVIIIMFIFISSSSWSLSASLWSLPSWSTSSWSIGQNHDHHHGQPVGMLHSCQLLYSSFLPFTSPHCMLCIACPCFSHISKNCIKMFITKNTTKCQ